MIQLIIQIFNLEKGKLFDSYIVPIKKEKINTKCFKSTKINKMPCSCEQNRRIFSNKDATYIWVLQNDKYHIPLIFFLT